jgi:hypothetical protein
MTAGGAAVQRRGEEAPYGTERGPLRLDRFELAVLVALFVVAVAALGGLLLRVWFRGGLLTGGEGYVVVDQLQYLAWLRDAGEHIAVGNPFDIEAGPRSLVHPGVVVSGLFHRLGLDLIAAYAIWKPVAVAALFTGTLLYVRRFVARRGDRYLALVLALFTASPVAALVGWLLLGGQERKFQFDFLAGEMWPVNYLWGYPFTAIAVGVMPLGLLAYERARAGGGRRMVAGAAVVGLVCSWLQPWQGATYALLLAGAEALHRRRESESLVGAARDLAPPLAATAAPLVYYWILSRADASWALADRANDVPRWPWWVMVIGLAPLALPALLAYRLSARDFGAIALRLWPAAALLVFYQPAGTFPFHALQGLTLPLVVLAMIGVRDLLGERPLSPLVGVAIAALMIVPGTIYRIRDLRGAVNKSFQPFFLTPEEHEALAYLDRQPESGGVLTPLYSGQVVPAHTGREAWVGAISWTPDYERRRALADRLFAGDMDVREAERLVRRSGARFLYVDCHGRADIRRLVAAVTEPPLRFGCAAVYRVRIDG